MGKQSYKQLSLEERCTITCFQKEGKSIRQIATAMARSPSTITREIKRNITKTKGYDPAYAHQQRSGRRWHGSKLERQPALRDAVLDRLAMGWSPQQIVNKLAQEQGCKVISYESIYRFIYAQIKRTKNYKWRHYLPRSKNRRGMLKRGGVSSVLSIKDRVSIHERPKYILKRRSAGHWEADLMLFSKYGQAILVAHERYSRMIMLFKLHNKKASGVTSCLINLFNGLPRQLAKSVTFDNGTEFAEHYRLQKAGMKTYFCDIKSPWQKGGVENAIGRLRRYLPRKKDIMELNEEDLKQIVASYNHTPRKCLDYKMPAEVFLKEVLHFECESTFPPSRE